jgi:hypothetical protein
MLLVSGGPQPTFILWCQNTDNNILQRSACSGVHQYPPWTVFQSGGLQHPPRGTLTPGHCTGDRPLKSSELVLPGRCNQPEHVAHLLFSFVARLVAGKVHISMLGCNPNQGGAGLIGHPQRPEQLQAAVH